MRTIKILITFGPASVPIDEVRRITNHSTGALGSSLVQFYRQKGHEVIALRGKGATSLCPEPTIPFETNDDLHRLLLDLKNSFQPDLILHVAALSDFALARIETPQQKSLEKSSKISSQLDQLTLHLHPVPKILPLLRPWFPKATIIGWKYELEGTHSSAISKAQKQVAQAHSDYCVINGKTYGEGFGICDGHSELKSHLNPSELAEALIHLPRKET